MLPTIDHAYDITEPSRATAFFEHRYSLDDLYIDPSIRSLGCAALSRKELGDSAGNG
jgi:hypothetical protein